MRKRAAIAMAVALVGMLWGAQAGAQDAPKSGAVKVAPLRLAVVIRHAGGASAEAARELQEVLIAALSGREEVRLLGGEELLQLSKLKDEDALTRCLSDAACATPLRERLNIRFLVLGKIDTTRTHHEFVIERFAASPEPWTRVLKVPVEQGLDGLLDPIYSTASVMPLSDAPVAAAEPPVEREATPELEGPSEEVVVAPPPRAPRKEGLGLWGYGGIGAGSVSLVTLGLGLYLHNKALNAQDDLQSELDNSTTVNGGSQGLTRARAKQLESQYNDSASLANVFYGVSLGAAVLSAGLWTVELLDGPEEAPATSLRLAPWLGTDSAGAGVVGTF